MPVISVATARLNTRQLAQILRSRRNKLPLDPRFLAPETIIANPLACFTPHNAPPLASRCHTRRKPTAQIPIAELAARPTEAYLPRFRALALFGRRPAERVVRSSLPASENLHSSRPEQVQQMREQSCGYSITSSARASSEAGRSRPSALAVLRLMTSSYLEACSTGRSAGLAPLRILST